MKLGICTDVAKAATAKAAGWDFVEENVQTLLAAHVAAGQWQGNDRVAAAELPVPAANCMVPGDLKITGPTADADRLAQYMAVVLMRAQRCGMKTIVFGSGGARQVPAGFDAGEALGQIEAFLRSAAPLAEDYGVTIAVEHLNRAECNILNGVAETAELVRRVGHPAVRMLFDTYHWWQEDEPLDAVTAAMPLVAHVHLASKGDRTAPGVNPGCDYGAVLKVIKAAGYDGRLSIEANGAEAEKMSPAVVKYVRAAWDAA